MTYRPGAHMHRVTSKVPGVNLGKAPVPSTHSSHTLQGLQERHPWLMRPIEVLDRVLTPARWPAWFGGHVWASFDLLPDTRTSAKALAAALHKRDATSTHRPGRLARALEWRVRRGVWSLLWAIPVAYISRPKRVPVPRTEPAIRLIPPEHRHADFKAPSLQVPERIPTEEASLIGRIVIELLHFLQDVYPIITPGQPPASSDPARRAAAAYPLAFRLVRPAPEWHPELAAAHADGTLLEVLAVGGPFAKLLERASTEPDTFAIDLRYLSAYPVRAGLLPLGCRMNFAQRGASLKLTSIEYEGRKLVPGDARYPLVERVAQCALLTHTTVWRHGMQYHVGGLMPFVVASHNLPPNHPLRRLLAQHVHETIFTSYHTHLTLRRSGFDVTGFSFSFETILRYYDDGVRYFDFGRLDPRLDSPRRGIPDTLDYPYLEQATRYFALIESYTRDYIGQYYPTDEAVRGDSDLVRWFEAIDAQTVGGIRSHVPELTRSAVSWLCAVFIYAVTVEHQENTLWEYLPFLPTSVRADGQEQSVGEVQSGMNFLFVIASATNRLMRDRSYLALDVAGAAIMRRFQSGLEELQAEYDARPDRYWMVPPRILDASVSS